MSVPTAGNFDCALAQTIIAKNEDVFNPENPNPDYVADVAPLQQLIAIQTAKFPDLLDPMKDKTVKVVTLDKCDADDPVEFDITGTCNISGTEAGTTCRDYELNIFKQSPGFSVSEEKFRLMGSTLTWEQELAVNLAAEIKVMDQLVANAVVSKYDAYSGANAYSKYDVQATYTNIPAAAWNPDLFTYFAVARQRNRRPNMSLLLGGLMEEALLKVELETGNPEGGSASRKVKQLGQVWSDMFTTETVMTRKTAFLVDPDSVFFASKARYSAYGKGKERIAAGNKQVLTTVKSNTMPSIRYNLILQESCVNGDTVTTGKLFFEGLIDRAPTRCTVRPQVLQFRCA